MRASVDTTLADGSETDDRRLQLLCRDFPPLPPLALCDAERWRRQASRPTTSDGSNSLEPSRTSPARFTRLPTQAVASLGGSPVSNRPPARFRKRSPAWLNGRGLEQAAAASAKSPTHRSARTSPQKCSRITRVSNRGVVRTSWWPELRTNSSKFASSGLGRGKQPHPR